MIVLETVNRRSIVKGLVEAMVGTNSVDPEELSDFVDALYSTRFDRWAVCEIEAVKLFEVCRAGLVFDKWQECDNVKSGRFVSLSSEPPPVVLYLNGEQLVLLDGRHRLVAANGLRKLIRAALPSLQLSRFKSVGL